MRRIALWCAVTGAVLVLAGCTSLPPIVKTFGRPIPPTIVSGQACFRGTCLITVDVNDCNDDHGIKLPDTVATLGGPGNGRKRLLVWVITNSGNYRFASDPNVALIAKGSSTFFGTPQVAGAVLVTEVSVETQGFSHEYGLTILKSDGSLCRQFDPWVIE